MELIDFKNALKATKLKQLDMLFWEFNKKNNESLIPKIRPITSSKYKSSKIITTRFYKIIRI